LLSRDDLLALCSPGKEQVDGDDELDKCAGL
jgi:hypothetical protein